MAKKLTRLYFAHNFNDRFEMRKFEQKIEAVYNINMFNPFYDSDRDDVVQLDKVGKNRKELKREMAAFPLHKCKDLVERDLREIRHSDGIVTMIKSASIGTSMEIITAGYFYRIPVYAITKTLNTHPWLRYIVEISGGEIFKTKNDFRKWLKLKGYERKRQVVRK